MGSSPHGGRTDGPCYLGDAAVTRLAAALIGFQLGWMLPAIGAHAANTNAPYAFNGTLTDESVSIGETATLVLSALPGGAARSYVYLENDSSALISCSWTSATPALAGSGTFSLSPAAAAAQGGWKAWTTPGPVPSSALYCVAGAVSSLLTAQSM